MIPVSREIITETTAICTSYDGKVLDKLLHQTPKIIKIILGDKIYDSQRNQEKIKRHGVKALAGIANAGQDNSSRS